MIAFLRGTLLEKHPNQVIVDTGGVGYDVQIPVSTFSALPNAGRFQMYIADPALLNLVAAKDRGTRELGEYSVTQERIDGDITEDFTGHIRAGTTFEVRNAFVPDSKNSFNPGLDATFLLISNTIHGEPGINRRYTISGIRIS